MRFKVLRDPTVLVLFLSAILTMHSQQGSPLDNHHTQVIYLEFEANNLSRDAVDLALSTSSFRRTETRENADLILHFDRKVSSEGRRSNGNEINVSINWDLSLEVFDRTGKSVWKTSMPLAMPISSGRTEDAWIERLRLMSEYRITKQFLKEAQN